MGRSIGAALATCALGLAGTAVAQESDDWEYGEDPARAISAAVARYDSGHAFAVRCQAGELRVAIDGLSAGDQPIRQLEINRGDGRRDRLPFLKMSDTSFLAQLPGRTARVMRGGGQIQVRAATGSPAWRASFELPARSMSLDRVLTACDRPLTNERDALPILSVDSEQWAVDGSESGWRQSHPGDRPDVTELACLVADSRRLTECRMDLVTPPTAFSAFVLRAAEGKSVTTQVDQAAGQVVYRVGPLIAVERVERLGPG